MTSSPADAGPPPVILFTKGGGGWIESIAASGCDAVGLDWTEDLGAMRRRVGHRVALQGNLDPLALYAPPERIRAELNALLSSFGTGSGHVFNLGHGIEPDTDPEHVRVLVDAVHELSVPYHSWVEPSGVEPAGVEMIQSELRPGFPDHEPAPVTVLDVKGLICPLPLLKCKVALNRLAPGAGAAHPRDGPHGVARLSGLLRPHWP